MDAGGIERVDPVSMTSQGFLITEEELGGELVDFALWSDTLAYAIVSSGLGGTFTTRLVSFDPSSGTLRGVVWDPEAWALSDCLVHPDGWLFVAVRLPDDPGVRVYDAATGALLSDGSIDTGLPPFELTLLPAREGADE
jgi:hypothetical protein